MSFNRRIPPPSGLDRGVLASASTASQLPPSPGGAARSPSTGAYSRAALNAPMTAVPLSAGTPQTAVRRATGTPTQPYRNSSDGVAAVLGGGSTAGAAVSPSRPRTRDGPRVALPASPQKGGAGAASSSSLFPPTSSGAAALSSTKKVEYACKVLVSRGTAATKPISLHCGANGVQGFRPTMEDCHFEVLNNGPHGGEQLSIVGVLDGHCGKHVADLASGILPEIFLAHPEAGKNNALALVEAIAETDRRIFQSIGRSDGGSTLICAVVHSRILTVACLGDARAVLCDGGVAVPLSIDHKPGDAEEVARVRRCGGSVQFGRVLGILAVSRALGDFEFKFNGNTYPNKEFMVSQVADIMQINITDASKFLILACDGLWDVMSNEEAVKFVDEFLSRNEADLATDPRKTLNNCALRLANAAVDAGSMDNVSVQILLFHTPESRRTAALTPSSSLALSSASPGGGGGVAGSASSFGTSSSSGAFRSVGGASGASPGGAARANGNGLPAVGAGSGLGGGGASRSTSGSYGVGAVQQRMNSSGSRPRF